jgi:hypothetical protein
VTDECDRKLGMLAAYDLQEPAEIVQVFGELPYVAARPLRTPVASVVVGVDRISLRGEPGAESLVATAVLGVTVHDDQSTPGLDRQPAAAKQPDSVEPAEVGLGSA